MPPAYSKKCYFILLWGFKHQLEASEGRNRVDVGRWSEHSWSYHVLGYADTWAITLGGRVGGGPGKVLKFATGFLAPPLLLTRFFSPRLGTGEQGPTLA